MVQALLQQKRAAQVVPKLLPRTYKGVHGATKQICLLSQSANVLAEAPTANAVGMAEREREWEGGVRGCYLEGQSLCWVCERMSSSDSKPLGVCPK